MDFDDSPEEAAFRAEARAWLEANAPIAHPARPSPTLGERDDPATIEAAKTWQARKADAGWACLTWPSEYGGRGATPMQAVIWGQEEARFRVPPNVFAIGIGMAGPTIMAHGTPEQRRRWLPKMARGEEIWCQLFSEPEAGSDLAALGTRAVLDDTDPDDEVWVVNGQKVWNSSAQHADFGILICRTDPTAPKHKGISWVICDMNLPGIEIREITTMSHVNDFCEVFYDDVRIPLSNVVGEINDGWRVTMTTLSFERGTAFMADQVELAKVVENLIEEARTRTGPDGKRPAIADDELARRLATCRAEVTALRAMTIAGISRTQRTGMPGPEGSMIRLFHGELHQRVYRLALDIIGPDAFRLTGIDGEGVWTGPYLQSFAYTIGGGTTDIQRNIVAERVLGLPRK